VNISKNAIRVSWDVIPRADRNGIILGYNIYTTEAFNYFATMPADYIAPQKSTVINTTDKAARSFIQLDLVPYTDYSFQVDAFTSKGKGPNCTSFIVRTEEEGIHAFISLGSGHYLWRAVAPKTNVFLDKNVADPTIKKSKNILPNLKYQLKNKYPPLAKKLTKGYHSLIAGTTEHFHEIHNNGNSE
jgi:hypothetical protein